MEKPVIRPPWRRRLGRYYYIAKRHIHWLTGPEKWARTQAAPLDHVLIEHQSVLLRPLRNVDMHLQHNKITNLRLAAAPIDGLLLNPGETFSFWHRVGAPSARKGYLEGLVLQNGQIKTGTGGGLCQMGNLLYWMALHTPLTVVERWRHSYDVFPDVNRTLPFGSGATLAYNYIDLQLRNDTSLPFQLCVGLTDTQLTGAVRSTAPWPERYEVFEQSHEIRHEPWGGYSRHNVIARRVLDANTGDLLREEVVAENHALMMYQPFLEG